MIKLLACPIEHDIRQVKIKPAQGLPAIAKAFGEVNHYYLEAVAAKTQFARKSYTYDCRNSLVETAALVKNMIEQIDSNEEIFG